MKDHFVCPNCGQLGKKQLAPIEDLLGISLGPPDLSKAPRIVYCRKCRGPLDNHALLLCKLDPRDNSAVALAVIVVACIVILMTLRPTFWWGALVVVMVWLAVGLAFSGIEKARIASYRLSPSRLEDLRRIDKA